MVIMSLHKKGVVGIAANRSTSLAWTSDGSIYRWGLSVEDGEETILDKNVSVKNIVSVVIGLGFLGILDMNHCGTILYDIV
jgi:hypothetical protein